MVPSGLALALKSQRWSWARFNGEDDTHSDGTYSDDTYSEDMLRRGATSPSLLGTLLAQVAPHQPRSAVLVTRRVIDNILLILGIRDQPMIRIALLYYCLRSAEPSADR